MTFFIGEKRVEHDFTVIDDDHNHNLHDIDVLVGWDLYHKCGIQMTPTHVILPGEKIPLMRKVENSGNVRKKGVSSDDDWGHMLRMITQHKREVVVSNEEKPAFTNEDDREDDTLDMEVKAIRRVIIPPGQAAMIQCRTPSTVRGQKRVPRQFMEDTLTSCSATLHDLDQDPILNLTIQNDSLIEKVISKNTPLTIAMVHERPTEMPDIIEDQQEGSPWWHNEWAKMADIVVSQSDNLDQEGKQTLRLLLEEYQDVFRLQTDKPGRMEQCAVPIHLTTPVPVHLPQYQLSAADNVEIHKQVNSMLKAGVIEPSISPYNFPVLLVDKKIIANEGKEVHDRRFCIDLQKLNAISEKINFPIPTCDHTIH